MKNVRSFFVGFPSWLLSVLAVSIWFASQIAEAKNERSYDTGLIYYTCRQPASGETLPPFIFRFAEFPWKGANNKKLRSSKLLLNKPHDGLHLKYAIFETHIVLFIKNFL